MGDKCFFRNIDCEYFPCHQSEEGEEFNCLFCYCPLYFFEDCGGYPVLQDKVKDCSNCDLPHRTGGPEFVLERLKRYFEEVRNSGRFNRE